VNAAAARNWGGNSGTAEVAEDVVEVVGVVELVDEVARPVEVVELIGEVPTAVVEVAVVAGPTDMTDSVLSSSLPTKTALSAES